jgi:hypothetical protein
MEAFMVGRRESSYDGAPVHIADCGRTETISDIPEFKSLQPTNKRFEFLPE